MKGGTKAPVVVCRNPREREASGSGDRDQKKGEDPGSERERRGREERF